MAKALKVKRYTRKAKEFQHNRPFSSKQGKFFITLDGEYIKTIPPNVEEVTKFWSGIWEVGVNHNHEAEWIGRVKSRVNGREQEAVEISLKDVENQ